MATIYDEARLLRESSRTSQAKQISMFQQDLSKQINMWPNIISLERHDF